MGFIFCVGYTNASWTLKADLTCLWLVRLLKHMDQTGVGTVRPKFHENLSKEVFLPLTSSYIQRAKDVMPKQGDHHPWKVYNNYFIDMWSFSRDITDNALVFDPAQPSSRL